MKIRFVNYNNGNYSLQYKEWWKWKDYKTPHLIGRYTYDCVFKTLYNTKEEKNELLKKFAKEKQLEEVEIYSELFKFEVICNY